ncbi:MAG: helix-hairpin-helix domain-containing protein, partial [Euryarchaeota archaeon]|nr:helix-hairpin-helix domain-containing protein [Euryarchaeota archaeon]
MIDEYTKLPYIGKKRAKKLQSHGIGLEDIAKMDELTLKKHIPRISTSKLKVIIATARDIVGRMYDMEKKLDIDRHKAKLLALAGYDVAKVAKARKKDLMKLLDVDEKEAFRIIFKAALGTGARRPEVKVKKEEIDRSGILSKEGFVNGFGSGWGDLKVESKVHFHVVPFLIVAVLITAGIGISLFFMNPGLTIDGNLSDWNSVAGYHYGNFTYKYKLIGNTLYFMIQKDNIFSTDESFYVAVDDGHGGYWMDGIQAHYVAEFYGWNRTLRGAHLWKYSSGKQLWNFTECSGMQYAVGDSGIEGELNHISSNSRVVFVEEIHSNVVLKTPPLSVAESTVQVVESTPYDVLTNGSEILKINVTAPGTFTLSAITLDISGANMTNGYVTVNGDRYSGVFSGAPVFKINEKIKNAIVCVYGNFSGAPASVVSVRAKLTANGVTFSYVYTGAKMYLYKSPETVKIDGAFGDWAHQNIIPDIIGDVYDANIDLVNYSHTSGFRDVFMQVRGEFMGGTDIPFIREWHWKDSDHDGVPDKFDPYPHDFNNDGIPDNESYVIVDGKKLPDVDGDGIPDYPYGPDMWLNTTIPSDFPKPYAGRHVSVYIGPPPPVKPKSGNDTAEIYFGGNNGGAHLYWVPFPVQYKITISGRDGLFNASEYEFESGNWIFKGYIKNIAAGYHRVELATGLNIPAGRMWITIFNWNHERDMPSVVKRATRSTTETNVFYFHADVNGNPGNMNWTMGSTSKEVYIPNNLGNKGWATWKYETALTEQYNVLSAVVGIYVDINNTFISSSRRNIDYLYVNLTAVNGVNSILVANNTTRITQNTYSSSGMYPYVLNPVNPTVPEGYYLELNITFTNTNGLDSLGVEYNSSSYPSNLTITTNTT